MHVQQEHLVSIVERCRARGLRTVVGGPTTSSVSASVLKADHIVIGEAEEIIADLALDLERGSVKPVYQAVQRPDMEISPLPDLSLIKMQTLALMGYHFQVVTETILKRQTPSSLAGNPSATGASRLPSRVK